jgi:hypothetical protein
MGPALYSAELPRHNRCNLVAGARFELATFGL